MTDDTPQPVTAPLPPTGVVLLAFLAVMLLVAVSLRVHRPVHRGSLTSRDTGFRINLNHADAATLQLLPGIGPALAQRIIAHRQTEGPFTRPEQLDDVKGVGVVKYSQSRPWITCDPLPRDRAAAPLPQTPAQ